MDDKKEEQLFRKRLKELALAASIKNYCIYTDFLNINEISIFYDVKKDIPQIGIQLWGGYTDAERKIICFYNEDIFPIPEFEISCLYIRPLNSKFSDSLTHRDFLGAVINLGIERTKLGDILIKNNEGYLFCTSKISTYIIENLTKIKHTYVVCEAISFSELKITPNYLEMTGTVSAPRLDAVLSVAFKSSRSSLTGLIEGGKVFVNSKQILSNSYILKENDIVSVRGQGKFIYKGTLNQTKKGRYYITLLKYI